jgi:hypothetical protein
MNPTKAEKKQWDRIAALGCIACLQDGIFNDYVSIHHVDGRTKAGCHKKVLALCGSHHQTGGQEAPAIHPYKAQFEAKYGTQLELMEKTAKLLAAS